ncbi:ATP-binding protein [Chiayiivirga flava]|uniref:histidine kinase n=1 Tax=Chiayiivirga flava TaxID=659595 RepID=A0A7W8G1S7_9GAMM|nr:dedicated sortase system histidine kinase [Chiayiivirga flava]
MNEHIGYSADTPAPDARRRPGMSLRNKLLLLALSTLVLPIAGWLLVRQLEALLREGQAQAQLASAEALARAVAARADALPPAGPGWFVHAATQPFALDGYDEEWQLQGIAPQTVAPGLRVALAQSNGALHLFIAVDDSSRVRADAHWSQAARADQVQLVLDFGGSTQRLRLASAAPGPLIVVDVDGGTAPRLLGEWQEDSAGYRIELRFPQAMRPRRMGLAMLDFSDPAAAPRRVGSGSADGIDPWPLIEPSSALHTTLAQLLPDGMRARLLHTEGWVLARAGAFAALPPQQQPVFWRRWLYRLLAGRTAPAPQDEFAAARLDSGEIWQALGDKPASAWRSLDDGRRLLLVTAAPVRVAGQVRGALLLERPSDALLLTNQALSGLMLATVLAMLVVGVVLFAFAGRLSSRIRHLSVAAERASTREGRTAADPFPRSASNDELGDLSRSFGKLLDEVNAYTDYLRSLAGKLSHELHTPLAVVRSSLENLESEALSANATTYVARARDGVDRLGAIVRAMSEASRMERAIASADAEDFDLRALLEGCADGYRPLLGTRELKLLLPAAPLPFHGAPELIAQALDKLVDNARSFCPADGWILLALAPSPDGAVLAVANAGPALPDAMQERLFNSLVSVRGASQRGDGTPHLGLGLSIVRLVAELHRGGARARNLPQGGGVEFRLTLRGMPRAR